jgi:hypothetical protein
VEEAAGAAAGWRRRWVMPPRRRERGRHSGACEGERASCRGEIFCADGVGRFVGRVRSRPHISCSGPNF